MVATKSDETQQENKNQPSNQTKQGEELQTQLETVTEERDRALDQAQRALADYQNLVRRTQEDRGKIVKLATRDFVEALLQPLDHLTLASRQLDDPGLNMVIKQLWQTLELQGLQKVDALGKPFDVETMEVIDKEDDGDKVIKVQSDGFTLNGELIRHAKVVVGTKK